LTRWQAGNVGNELATQVHSICLTIYCCCATKAQKRWQGGARGAPGSFILQGSRDEQPTGQLFVASHLCFDACQQQRLQEQGQPLGLHLSVVATTAKKQQWWHVFQECQLDTRLLAARLRLYTLQQRAGKQSLKYTVLVAPTA